MTRSTIHFPHRIQLYADICGMSNPIIPFVIQDDVESGNRVRYVAHTAPPDNERFSSITTGQSHGCGLRKSDGSAVCWGYGGDEPDGRFIAISGGRSHTCALRVDGSPECWGDFARGASTPPADERFTSIGSGIDYSCGLRTNGTVRCWGENL